MNKLMSLAFLLANLTTEAKKGLTDTQLEHFAAMYRGVAEREHPEMYRAVKCEEAENNAKYGSYLDFRITTKPTWCCGTDEVQIVLSVNSDDASWYVRAFVDDSDGPKEEWGEAKFKPEDLDDTEFPFMRILGTIHTQYEAMLVKERITMEDDLKAVLDVKQKMEPHVQAIKDIAKAAGVKLYVDRNIEGSNVTYLVPSTFADDAPDKTEVKLECIPFIDFGAHGFDSAYDTFTRK